MTGASHSVRSLPVWVTALTSVTAAVALGSAVTTPARSGPLCREACLGYPYVDAAQYVPRDYLWMYAAVVLLPLALAWMHLLEEGVHAGHRLPRRLPTTVATVGVTVLLLAYGIQLGYVQPSLVAGETQGLTPWSQYNPHGVFIAMENAGYAMLAIALTAAGVALLAATSRADRVAGVLLTATGGLTLVLLVLLPALYRWQLEYRFEVAAIALVLFALVAAPAVQVLGALQLIPDRRGRPAVPVSRERVGT